MTASVIYRTDPLTLADYDEAIQSLQEARVQIVADELWHGCAYCGSEEHNPNSCHHNPLVMARRLLAERDANSAWWRCFHCDETFAKEEETQAREHFGLTLGVLPMCVLRAFDAAGVRYRFRSDEDG